MRLLFIGPPGAGKGTQAMIISKHCSIPQISTGDMLRRAVKKGSDLGKKAERYMNAGLLVPDELVVDIVRERIGEQDACNGFILDGFPRNMEQVDMLNRILADLEQQLDIAFNLDVPRQELVNRLLTRAKDEGRLDDNEEIIKVRLAAYEKETHPLLDYYRNAGILYSIDGTGSMEEVSGRLLASIS